MQSVIAILCYHRFVIGSASNGVSEVAMGTRGDTRERIVRAAADLLATGGREAVSTRVVAAAAGVPTPTIYRLFGDMRGLLDAVAAFEFAAYLREKTARESATDPVEELRRGWDQHVGFGLANPAIYQLMVGDPRPGAALTATREGADLLHGLVSRIAESGRLRVGVDRATRLIHAAASGITLALLGTAPEERDLALSATAREAILAAIITDATAQEATAAEGRHRAAHRAVALKAVLFEVAAEFTPGERLLLAEWLDTIATPR